MLFRPLAFPNANELITVWLDADQTGRRSPGSRSDGIAARSRCRRSASGARGKRRSATSRCGRRRRRSSASRRPRKRCLIGRASASLLPVLGVRPEIGAWFSEADDAADGARVAVVSHETWAAQVRERPAHSRPGHRDQRSSPHDRRRRAAWAFRSIEDRRTIAFVASRRAGLGERRRQRIVLVSRDRSR